MSDGITRATIEEARADTNRQQAAAANPASSVWVTANAGTGKTHVLVLRVLRLLLAGTLPERILCLTYTKAAAAEMSKRVFDELAKWVTLSDGDLEKALQKLLARAPSHDEIGRARTLFTAAIETPGGFKVQTIHAFAERLLQRFPIEAGVPAGFSILDDLKGRELKARAIDATLKAATSGNDMTLRAALNEVIRFAADNTFDSLIAKAMAERDVLDDIVRRADAEKRTPSDLTLDMLRRRFDLSADDTAESVVTAFANVVDPATSDALIAHLGGGKKSDLAIAESLKQARHAPTPRLAVEHLKKAFLVDGGTTARKRIMTAKLAEADPALNDAADDIKMQCLAFNAKLLALDVTAATAALYELAIDAEQKYRDNKANAGALDFDDLIRTTQSLLANSNTSWVLFKLDGGLDHILVDEAQDTSPEQWDIVQSLAAEIFSGSGARDTTRTVFAVGDEKQSIYSFQGAAPRMFADVGRTFEKRARDAEVGWHRISLAMSFRTVAPILDAVDRTFKESLAADGVAPADTEIRHIADRVGQAGVVEIWEPEFASKIDAANVWAPLGDTTESAPANRLAERIARRIRRWLDDGEMLQSQNRPIRAGDILILVRKRNPFAAPMVAALKRAGIPVAGADRMRLIQQLAVQDLMVLGDFLTLPEDDLALATVLKGPFFNLTDDDLLAFAAKRGNTPLWKALLAWENPPSEVATAIEQLKTWRKRADFIPPFEFFAELLERDGGRRRILNRLGPEAADAIDEFLDQALAYDDANAPSLTGFLCTLRTDEKEVKREVDLTRNEVRVMTVHGAKGLEAPIVFLPDTCSVTKGETPGARLVTLEDDGAFKGRPAPFVWPVKSSSWVPTIAAGTAVERQADDEERNRLLYVAMTRARDRLYVAGFSTREKLPEACWYEAMASALVEDGQPADALEDGARGWRRETLKTSDVVEDDKKAPRAAAEADERPAFALTPAASEPQLSIPMAPSQLAPYAMSDEGEPDDGAPRTSSIAAADHLSPEQLADARRFLRGTLTHALLQHLPAIEPAERKRVADAFVAARGDVLKAQVRASIVAETLAILNDETFAPLFARDSRAEVSIAAEIPRPANARKGPALRLSGQIDRLAIAGDTVLIVDYKTNRPPPAAVGDVADAYLFQLAAYVLALRHIYPSKKVMAALLWTDGPRLMVVPETLIESAIERLWSRDFTDLDVA